MNYLTAALYGALLVYLGGWYMDRWIGNFALLLFILSAVTFVYWLAERFRFKPAREAAAQTLEAQDAAPPQPVHRGRQAGLQGAQAARQAG